MSNHNYSQYSTSKKKKNNNNRPKFEETIEQMAVVEDITASEVVTDVAAPVEPLEVKMAVETVDTVAMPMTVTGTVAGCTKLNVRSNPAVDADILAVVDNNTVVEIDPARSDNEWLKITTASGVDGYCMRKFVSAKL